MSYLEERLLKIVELRKLGVFTAEIAEGFNMCSNSLLTYESFVRRVLRGNLSLSKAAEKCNVSESVLKIAAEYYGIGKMYVAE